MRDLFEVIYSKYMNMLEKMMIGYNGELELDQVWELIHTVYFAKFGHPNEAELLFICDKYETATAFLDDFDVDF